MKRILLFLVLVALALGACDTNRSVPLDQIAEPVAFVNTPVGEGESASRSDRELAVLDAASGETWQLTSDWANDAQPTWSPSGTHLMFISGREIDSNGPIPPWPTSTGINKVFVYDLKPGTIQHIDLSWALESGPAMPQESEESMKTLGWLECAAWSPVDTTKIAVGVTIKSAHWKDPSKREEMIPTERRIVLLDMEEKTGRMLTKYIDPSCHRLFWSPDGKHIGVIGGEEIDYIRVATGEEYKLQGDHVLWGDSLHYVPLDWGPNGDSLLVRGYSRKIDSLAVYRYNVEDNKWSSSLGKYADVDRVVQYAPWTTGAPNRDFIVLRSSPDSYHDDLWRYLRLDGKFERLTDDQNPKTQHVVSYQRKMRMRIGE